MKIINQKAANLIAENIIKNNTPPPTEEDILQQKISEEKSWRNEELVRTDALVILPDYPYSEQLLTYRQELRDYPQQEDFPNGTRPIKP